MENFVPRMNERRVHVVPLGHEYDRIVTPLHRHGADVVYLLVSHPDRDADRGAVNFDVAWEDPDATDVDVESLTEYQRDALTTIAEFAEVRPLPVRLNDVYDVLGVATTVAAQHAVTDPDGDRLFANVSTGPRITAVGLAMACMVVGARPYSVTPAEHNHNRAAESVTAGVDEIIDLPLYPVDGPSAEQVAILGRIHEREANNRTTDKWNLIEWAQDYELHFVVDAGGSRTAKYRALETHILTPLRERGYVELRSVGRSDDVHLTDTGRRVYYAFEHKNPTH
ncbi:DUF6293 family protein [Natronocalculus amylovorans]|uniref:DUF6293 family protein n=1 Tax=Natronocalculus amylovorans TaxID=2917812 RepID=A0AAE3FYK4_9EURY|nr:DUF6293 family protein [Natronocalculus amylovorans]MCL9817747.1 DUF6293 family protein [Natronocalculus amylovorans]